MKREFRIEDIVPSIENVFVPIHNKGMKEPKTESILSTYNSNTYHSRMLKEIEKAKHTIMISSFLIADEGLEDMLIRKAEDGVRVYLLTSTDAQLKKLDKEELSEFDQETVTHHISLLKKLAQSTLCRSAQHLHAKFLLVDPVIDGAFNPGCFALVSTANFTTKGMTISPELIVVVDEVNKKRALYQLFLKGFWQEAEQELRQSWVGISDKRSIPEPEIPHTSKGVNSLKRDLLARMRDADSIIMGAYSMDDTHETMGAVLNSSSPMTVFTRLRMRNHPILSRLMERDNTLIKIHKDIHAKFLITETGKRYRGIVFTANFTSKGLDTGFEVGIPLNQSQTVELLKIVEYWSSVMQYEYRSRVGLKNIGYDHLMVREGRRIVRKDLKENHHDRKKIQAKKVKDIVDAGDWIESVPEFIGNDIKLKVTKELEITVPRLPKKFDLSKLKKRDEKISGKKYHVYSPDNSADFLVCNTPLDLVRADAQFSNLRIYRSDHDE